jgi:hypothetical protein
MYYSNNINFSSHHKYLIKYNNLISDEFLELRGYSDSYKKNYKNLQQQSLTIKL